MKRIGVLLSGCGVKDGSEIHEATLTLLYLARSEAETICMAPDAPQPQVLNHLDGKPMSEERNMLIESARIARGEIRPLSTITADDLDGIILPGGFGAATNLCNYGMQGRDFTVRADVAALLTTLHEKQKPIGAICIAPVLLAGLFGRLGIAIEVTIGNDAGTAADIDALGARHIASPVHEAHVDRGNRIATAPAYMLGQNAAEIAPGIEKVVAAVIEMA